MNDELLNYYEQELSYIRRMGGEFARKYPKIAGRLLLDADKSADPHTERLIEAFAFIAGRIHKKIDDDFPEITESLFSIIYPHYNNPIPSLTIVRFDPLLQNISEGGYLIDRGTKLFSRPVNGETCIFQTCQPVAIWPLELAELDLREPKSPVKGAQQVIYLKLKTVNRIPIAKLDWSNLRFFLHGQQQHVFYLYELLFNNVCRVEYETGGKKCLALPPESISPVGFSDEESVLSFSQRSFPGYRLLFEYFCFPEKFLSFDLTGLEGLKHKACGDSLEVRIYLNRIIKDNVVLDRKTFTLNAAPAVNLFNKIAEPIRVEQRKTEYRVIPDIRRQDSTEVYTVDRVTASTANGSGEQYDYKPFYSMRHHLQTEDHDERRAYWHVQRRESGRYGDKGTEVFLSFTDLDFLPTDPGVDIMTIHTTCSNRDLPARMAIGAPDGDFDLEIAAPITRTTAVMKPTRPRRPTLGGGMHWRLISHLSLNYLSLVEGGRDALREILRLYDFDDSPVTRQQIDGIVGLSSSYVTKRIRRAFGRGIQVVIEFDEDKYVGAGIFLFSSILEKFLGQYVSVNSFSQLIVKTMQRSEVLHEWPPRSGKRIIL